MDRYFFSKKIYIYKFEIKDFYSNILLTSLKEKMKPMKADVALIWEKEIERGGGDDRFIAECFVYI